LRFHKIYFGFLLLGVAISRSRGTVKQIRKDLGVSVGGVLEAAVLKHFSTLRVPMKDSVHALS